MADADRASVSGWIRHLKDGDAESARLLWDHYFQQVVRVARRRLGTAPRRVADEEDVALSVFQSLCHAAMDGRFPKLMNRNELWKLLLSLTNQKVIDRLRADRRLKRGGGNVRGESVFSKLVGELPETGLAGVADNDRMPDLSLLLSDLLGLLRDDLLRNVALARLEGCTNTEVAERFGIAVGTVERKLKLIRETWSKELRR